MSTPLVGHCLCGAVRLEVADHDPRIGACHCRMCQRWSGGLFLSFPAKPEGFRAEGPVVRHQSSAFAERAFCGTCGSHLWMRDTDKTDAEYWVMPGLFEEAASWPLRSEIYTDRAYAALRLEGDHKRATRDEYEAKNAHVTGDMS